MFPISVNDPSGRHWTVSLQFIPNRQGIGLYERFIGRLRRKRKTTRTNQNNSSRLDWSDLFLIPDTLDSLWLILAIIVGTVFFIFVCWPLLLLLFDFIWLVLILFGALISFVGLRRPITILVSSGEETRSWKVRGVVQAFRQKRMAAEAIAQGQSLDQK